LRGRFFARFASFFIFRSFFFSAFFSFFAFLCAFFSALCVVSASRLIFFMIIGLSSTFFRAPACCRLIINSGSSWRRVKRSFALLAAFADPRDPTTSPPAESAWGGGGFRCM
jgi:hypothetical protein